MKQTHVVNNSGVAAAPRESAFFRKAAVLLETKSRAADRLLPPGNMALLQVEGARGTRREVLEVKAFKSSWTTAKPLSGDEVKKVLAHKGQNGAVGYLVQVDPEELRISFNLSRDVLMAGHAVAQLPALSLVGGGGTPYTEKARGNFERLRPLGEVPAGAVEKVFMFVPAAMDRVAKTALAFAVGAVQPEKKKPNPANAKPAPGENTPAGKSGVAFGGVGSVPGWDAPLCASEVPAGVPQVSPMAERLNLP